MKKKVGSAVLLAAILITAGCSFLGQGALPKPEVRVSKPLSPEAVKEIREVLAPADASRGWTFDLAAWLCPREKEALRAFLADVPRMDHPDERARAPFGEVRGWKGPFNSCGYGLAEWVRRAGHRYENADAWPWLRAHVMRNVFNYWVYFSVKQRGPNEGVGYRWEKEPPTWLVKASGLSGIPITALVHTEKDRGYYVPEADKWDGSSYGRHHTYDFIATCIDDPAAGLSADEQDRALAMLTHYAHDRVDHAELPQVTHRHEYAHYPIRTYVAIYRCFKGRYREAALAGDAVAQERWELAQRCLQAAEGLVWYGFHPAGPGKPRAIQGRDGSVYWAWDPGQPDDPYWHQLNQIRSEKPWYVGLRASAWFYLWMEPDCHQWIRDLIGWVIREEARWCTRDWNSLPPCSLAPNDRPGAAANGWLHGGMLPGPEGDRWVRADSRLLTPDTWSALPKETPYHPLTVLLARESDNGYWARWWPEPDDATGYLRYHYPKINVSQNGWPGDFGPRLDINGGASWAGMPDLLFLAGVLNGDVEQVKTACWLYHDYVGYSHLNWGGHDLRQPKAKATTTLYGGLHTTRGFYWVAMACGEILRCAAMDGALEGMLARVQGGGQP